MLQEIIKIKIQLSKAIKIYSYRKILNTLNSFRARKVIESFEKRAPEDNLLVTFTPKSTNHVLFALTFTAHVQIFALITVMHKPFATLAISEIT